MPTHRPFSVTVLTLMVLTLTTWGAARLIAALRWRAVLTGFESSVSPLYLSVTGAGWVAAGCVVLAGIISIKRWAPVSSAAFILIWLIEYWLERIFFQNGRGNLQFAVLLSLCGITVTAIAAFLPVTKNFFIKK